VATYVPHLKVILSGTLGNDQPSPEIFALGFAIGGPTPVVSLGPQAAWDTARAAITSWWGAGATLVNPAARITTMKLAFMDTAGHVATNGDGSFAQYKNEGLSIPGGGPAGPLHPPQVAMAVSLYSNRVGAVGRGRFYLPLPSIEVAASTLGIARPDQQAVVNSTLSMLTAVGAALGGADSGVCVASGGSVKHALAPANYRVTRIRVGAALDTIRARRGKVSEAYVDHAL
jgi:hypothetical protein